MNWLYKCLGNVWVQNILIVIFVFGVFFYFSWDNWAENNFSFAYIFNPFLRNYLIFLFPIYFNNVVLIRFFFDKGKYGLYFGLMVILLIGNSYLDAWANDLTLDFNVVFRNLWSIIAGFGLLFTRRQIVQRQQEQSRQLLQREQELKYLKAQINPHFLFNALNSIYALSRNRSEETPEVVLQLSQLLRYQLGNLDRKFVFLKDEIEFLNNYILLEETRLAEHCRIEFEIEGLIQQQLIAPMLLIPFVENAFKHGIDATRKDNYVEIQISLKDTHFKMVIQNSKSLLKSQQNQSIKIGQENARKRLQLIYPNAHKLKVKETEMAYSLTLTISL